MSDTGGERIEPFLPPSATDAEPAAAPAGPAPAPAPPPAAPAAPAEPSPAPAPTPSARSLAEQLARIEEKAARIEEKQARAEALMLRLEDKVQATSNLSGELARQSDLAALNDRVARLPGYSALIVTALIAAVLAASFTVALIKFLPGGIG